MGKSKSSKVGGGKKGEKSAASSAAKKCTCDHLYQCDCGNRPERPSRGHKWDPTTQTWGGKGHKQKGGSGQTATTATADKVTSSGNTTLKQWQKLPSKLLYDLCKKNGKSLGKGLPIYRPINARNNNDGGSGNAGSVGGGSNNGKNKKYRYRLIIPDASKNKNSDNDIILTPSLPVSNDEQAKEEVALLGLLCLFPKLPHERTLPEPYRSTFLVAMKNQNDAASAANANAAANSDKKTSGGRANGMANIASLNSSSTTTKGKQSSNVGGATLNTQLSTSLPYQTKSQFHEAKLQHKRNVQARIRKHEAIRNVNKPMEVFMSSRFRKRIEALLSGNNNVFEEGLLDGDDNDEEHTVLMNGDGEEEEQEEEDVVRSYVHQRLVHEGFNSSHALKAYREAVKTKKSTVIVMNDDAMDKAYEECLQYLCIHLREDQLPIGFDSRGGTLDVISSSGSGAKKKRMNEQSSGGILKGDNDDGSGDEDYDTNILQFAQYFGLTPKEANAIYFSDKASCSSTEEMALKRAFWTVMGDAASLSMNRTCFSSSTDEEAIISDEDKDMNIEAASNECEALGAIFEEGEFSITKDEATTTVTIALPFGDDDTNKLSLEVHYINGMYPSLLPAVFITSGTWTGKGNRRYQFGGKLHLKLVEYMKDMMPGTEVIFELFGHIQSLLQEEIDSSPSVDNVSELLVRLKLDDNSPKADNVSGSSANNTSDPDKNDNAKPNQTKAKQKKKTAKPQRRPRERSTFWNTSPAKTQPAESYPKLSPLIDRARKSLPAAKSKDKFLTLMSNAQSSGRVVLVTGETGCGKTTQIPQFILENAPVDAKIIVAQPRRLACTGVSARVALERGEFEPGKASVGYVVRGDSKMCASTRLMFCTTGVLLRQLQSQTALENITTIVVDEVHERHLDTDVLLAILKKTLPSLPNLTVVLMSATMDADRFAAYWGNNTPRMHIPGFTHPVKDCTLEDVLQMTNYIPPRKKKKNHGGGGRGRGYQIQPSYVDGDGNEDEGDEEGPAAIEKDSSGLTPPFQCAVPLEERLKRMNEEDIDYDLIAALIKTLLQTKDDDGSILCFLPGAGEIDRAERVIQQVVRGHDVTILPLHGGLQPDKQQQVFVPARKGYTKIILSTNVAETSITIPDCTVVIDTCKEKKSSFDPTNRMPLLLECFASRDSLKQRRGRAGRVRPGTCYKLISSSKHGKLPEHGEPEIRRCALDQTILSLIFLGLEDGSGSFLQLMLDPPSNESIQSALYSLEKTGALDRNGNEAFLTPLGTHLSGIPAPPVIGKMLVMGCLLGCRSIAVAIAAGLSGGRNPFLRINTFNNYQRGSKDNEEQEKENFTNNKILEARAAVFKEVGKSDHVMLGKVFLMWKDCKGAAERRRFCDKIGLAFNSMRDILTLSKQLDSSLTTSGFIPSNDCNRNEGSWRIVRSMLCAALSPTQIVRVQKPTTKYTETVEGAVEKDGKAKELKFFIRSGGIDGDNSNSNKFGDRRGNDERVFIHPSSNNFSVGSYSCPWLVYHRLVRTSKAFVSDATECNPYSLLLFGGSMEVQASKGLIVLDDWIQLSANARIGSLIGGLRQKVDELLERKVADPSIDTTGSAEMKLITELLRHDGV